MENENITARRYSAQLSIFFGAVFLVVGSYMPFFPVWLDWKGLSPNEIGIIIATPLLVRVAAAPLFSILADKIGDVRFILIILSLGTFVSLLGLVLTEGFLQIFFGSLLVAAFWTGVMPLSDAAAMEGMRRAGIDYGRVRICGSLTFIAASLGGGLILNVLEPAYALWIIVGASATVVLTSFVLPRPRGLGRLKTATTAPRLRFSDAVALLRTPHFVLFLLTASVVQTSHALLYGFGTLHWQSLGLSNGVIGTLWGTGVVAEIILFLFSSLLFAKVGAAWLLIAAAAAGVLRWTITAADPPLAALFGCQILHALTFGAGHLASVDYIAKFVPEGQTGTALGLYAALAFGIILAAATMASGWLYDLYAGKAYLFMAVISLCGLVGALMLLVKRPNA